MSAACSLKTSSMRWSAASASMSARSRSNTGPRRSVRSYDQPEAELLVGHGVDQQHAGARVLGQVPSRLREELVGERDALVVDEVHAGQVGDVGGPVGRRGRDHRRHRPLEAQPERLERHARSWRGDPGGERRRPGPVSGRRGARRRPCRPRSPAGVRRSTTSRSRPSVSTMSPKKASQYRAARAVVLGGGRLRRERPGP